MTTRLLLTCAAIGAAFGVVAIGTTYAMAALFALAPVFVGVLSGYFIMPGVVAQALLRKPGVAILTHLFAAIIAFPFSPPGVTSGGVLLFNGVVLEAAFAIGRYRYWKAWVHFAAATVLAGIGSAGVLTVLAAEKSPTWMFVLVPVLLLVADLAYVWVGRLVAAGVARTGVAAGIAGAVNQQHSTRPTDPADIVAGT